MGRRTQYERSGSYWLPSTQQGRQSLLKSALPLHAVSCLSSFGETGCGGERKDCVWGHWEIWVDILDLGLGDPVLVLEGAAAEYLSRRIVAGFIRCQ